MTHLKPKEILNGTINSAAEKAQGSFRKLLILSILAGAFIALAGSGGQYGRILLFGRTGDHRYRKDDFRSYLSRRADDGGFSRDFSFPIQV